MFVATASGSPLVCMQPALLSIFCAATILQQVPPEVAFGLVDILDGNDSETDIFNAPASSSESSGARV